MKKLYISLALVVVLMGSVGAVIQGGGSFLTTEADTLDTVFDRGKTIDGANSLANAVRIGDGVTPGCFYTDATLGFLGIPCTASNTSTLVLANFNWMLWDQEGAAAILTADPDAIGAGSGTLTMATGQQLVASNLGVEFAESDTNPTCAAGNYNIYADTSETKIKKCVNGVTSELATDVIVRKTANETVNNNGTPQNDDELFFSAEANSVYKITMFVMYTVSEAADFEIDFTLPASATGYSSLTRQSSAATTCATNPVQNDQDITTAVNGIGGAGTVEGTDKCVLHITGIVVTAGTAGTVQFQWSQTTPEVSDAIVYANSYLTWRKM